MNTPSPADPQTKPQPLWARLLWLVLTSLGLLLISEGVRQAPCLLLPLLICVLAYPMWLGLRESFLFKRRLMLRGATPEDSTARRFFWQGHLGASLLVIPALILSALLLALSVRLTAAHWAILVADAVLVALLYGVFQRSVASQVHAELLGVVVRGWPLWLSNLLLLSSAFVVLSVFQGVPDVRHESWHAVAEQAFYDQQAALRCPLAGSLTGLLAALDQGSWALAQQYIPRLPGLEWRLGAWLLFLGQLGALAFFFSRLLLGVLALVEQRALSAEAITGRSLTAKTFVFTILLLALPVLYASLKWRDIDPNQFATPVPAQTLLAQIDPCRAQPTQTAAVQADLAQHITAEQAQAQRRIERRIARELDLLFAPVEAGVEDYLDWYFTVVGEYQRIGALIAGDIVAQMHEQLADHLYAGTNLDAQLLELDRLLLDDTLEHSAHLTQEVKARLVSETEANPCSLQGIDSTAVMNLDRDLLRAGGSITSGAVAGATTLKVSKTLAATLSAKLAAKKSMQVAAVTAGKTVTKKGASTLAAAAGGTLLCAPSGAFAVLCGVGSATVAWFTVDKVAIEIEEAVSRDNMRADILAALDEEKQALKTVLQQRHQRLLMQLTTEVQQSVDGLFIPARDGL